MFYVWRSRRAFSIYLHHSILENSSWGVRLIVTDGWSNRRWKKQQVDSVQVLPIKSAETKHCKIWRKGGEVNASVVCFATMKLVSPNFRMRLGQQLYWIYTAFPVPMLSWAKGTKWRLCMFRIHRHALSRVVKALQRIFLLSGTISLFICTINPGILNLFRTDCHFRHLFPKS